MRAVRSFVVMMALAPTLGRAQAVPAEAAAATEVEDPRLAWRGARWACLVGGGVAVTLGLLSYANGVDDESAVTDAARDERGVVTGLSQREALRLQDSAGRFKSLGALSIGLGAALVAAGVTLWALEPPGPAATPKAPDPVIRPFSLAPSFGPDGPGLVLGGRF
ncbi:MAG: hypothetical protein H6706_10250 [Myxococcales bacterium]|nr:hypothetical protein [Myxococcales bacterium]